MKILILGAQGTLGSELVNQLQGTDEVVALGHSDLDVADAEAVSAKVEQIGPEIIFNCVAYNAVDKAEEDPTEAKKINTEAPLYIARAAEKVGAILVHFSSNFVFEGTKQEGYTEDDQPKPINVYGETKYEGEQAVLNNCSKHYIVRLSVLFGPQGKSPNAKKTFPDLITDLSKEKESFDFVNEEISSPTYSKDLVEAVTRLVKEKYPYGVYHLANEGMASWYDFAKEIFELKGITSKINSVPASAYVRPAKRPHHAGLVSTKFPKLRTWQEALRAYLNDSK
jgi:dTDP-4-dehydrorhamnose reductase